jgi:predicted transcriptional regulator with HTH domain
MITAGQLEKFTNISADQMTDLMCDLGYDIRDESFINTCFMGMNTRSSLEVDFIYQGMYIDVHGEGGLQYAKIIVTYDTMTEEMKVDYAD